MAEAKWLAECFEQHRPRLRAAAYRMLGSVAEADDAVQDAWLRLHGSDPAAIDNLGGWLTTVVARECLHVLRSRRRRREEPYEAAVAAVPDGGAGPEQQAVLADSVGLALLVVLEQLTPAERLAFVLHDLFELPFEDVAGLLGRTPAAARQLASRGRRRLRGAGPPSAERSLAHQRRVVDAFYAAARAGDFDGLLRVLDPDVMLRADVGPDRPPVVVRGAAAVARLAREPRGARLHPVLRGGAVGALVTLDGRPYSAMFFTVVADRIVFIDGVLDPARLPRLAATAIPPDETG